jgi:hypothetical protein
MYLLAGVDRFCRVGFSPPPLDKGFGGLKSTLQVENAGSSIKPNKTKTPADGPEEISNG